MNRKGLLGFIVMAAAVCGTMALSSCKNSEDYSYNEDTAKQAANMKYTAAFVQAFGKPAANVDWGFSSKGKTRSVGDYASSKGSLQPTVSFPEDCDASKFVAEVPEGVNKLPTWGAGPGTYYIDGDTRSVSTWAGISHIYVTGNVDLSDGDTAEAPNFSPAVGSEIYLLEGSTLKLGTYSAINFNVVVYIAEGAQLVTDGLLKANASTKVYNHGTISVGTFEVNTSSFLYNVGLLEASESVNVESNNSRIVNDGTVRAASVLVNAGALQNNAEWTVTGNTTVRSNNSGWVNNGHWTTYDYAYIGGSENVINNCRLDVENDFEMNISSDTGVFKLDAGCGVVTKNFYGGRDSSTDAISGPFKIVMGENSLFKVEETAVMECGRGYEEDYGIYGPTEGGYAVFQAKNIVRDSELERLKVHGAVTYSGHLYVSAETHFSQGDDGSNPPKMFIYEKGGFSIDSNIYAEGFKAGKPDITIEETPCCPGFIGGTAPLYRVIAEDLSAAEAGDFDFNDVVFDVVKAENGRTTLKLICAGGVLPMRVRGATEAEGVEIHSVFGETAPNARGEYKMYNTGAGPTVPAATFTVEGEYTTPEQIKNIIIEVKKDGTWMKLRANRGEAACKILVDDTFVPVPEKKNIADVNLRFTDYVQGSFQDDFWWK